MKLYPESNYLNTLLYGIPAAFAKIQGSIAYPDLHGIVRFYATVGGVLVNPEIYGLPVENPLCSNHFFAFHIHEGRSCTGTAAEPFADAGGHFNPAGCDHPSHAGDLPPLFANHEGAAWSVFLSDRFKWKDVIGRTVIVHAGPDDFHSQPSGNPGPMIACGVIKQV